MCVTRRSTYVANFSQLCSTRSDPVAAICRDTAIQYYCLGHFMDLDLEIGNTQEILSRRAPTDRDAH
jgi:hypothetical protein